MTRFTVFLIAVFYVLAVACGIILLTAVQFRSSTGAVFDTWLLKHDANRAFNREIQEQLEPAKKELASALDSVNFTVECLKLFDDDGTLTPATSRFQAEADKARASGRSNDPNLRTEVACVLRGYTSLAYDKPYYDKQVEDFSAKIAKLEDFAGGE